jgi:hypothetical protein
MMALRSSKLLTGTSPGIFEVRPGLSHAAMALGKGFAVAGVHRYRD